MNIWPFKKGPGKAATSTTPPGKAQKPKYPAKKSVKAINPKQRNT